MALSRRSITFAASFAGLLLLGSTRATAGDSAPAAPPGASRTLPEALLPYAAVGSSLAASSRLAEVGWTDEQIEAFLEGVRAGIRGQGYPLDEDGRALFATMSQRLAAIDAERRARVFADPEQVEAYMKDACTNLKLKRSDSGLAYGIMDGGAGIRPSPEDTVIFSMSATADDAKTEIPNLTREKVRARVSDLIPGLSEGMQRMTLGAQAMLVIPPDLSFGDGTWPEGAVRGAPILVIITLHEIISPPVDP